MLPLDFSMQGCSMGMLSGRSGPGASLLAQHRTICTLSSTARSKASCASVPASCSMGVMAIRLRMHSSSCVPHCTDRAFPLAWHKPRTPSETCL